MCYPMISIVWQGNHRYNVCRSGQNIGFITVSNNPYHNRHSYLNLCLGQYDPTVARELFSLLRKELRQPLQVMLYSTREMYNFLIAGGFERKRRCYEIEVSSSDLIVLLRPSVELQIIRKGSSLYAICCDLLYAYYSATHKTISPLTVPQEVFCADLPETVVCCIADKKPIHYAFIEEDETGYEIAYVGTRNPDSFSDFAQALVFKLFQKCDFLTMECDDTDPAAMQLINLFNTSIDESYDTYIHE